MIPKRLELRNFLSYGNQVTPIDFSGMHLVCLSGENGNGKSAILDAITWALWGEGRGRPDDMIRLGADEMRVVFDFELDGDLYQVIRARNRRNSGNVWELYAIDPAGSKRSLTGQGIRQTGDKIKHLLKMDYRTFINSAYIQQGRADEFTKQTATDRKRILADILNLSRYDQLEQKAKARRNECDQRILGFNHDITARERELENESELIEKLGQAKAQRETLDTKTKSIEAKITSLMAERQALDVEARKANDAHQHIKSLQNEIVSLEKQRVDLQRRIDSAKATVVRRDEILDRLARLNSAIAEKDTYDRKLEALRTLRNDAALTQHSIDASKSQLEMELRNLRRRQGEMENDARTLEGLRAKVAPLRDKVRELQEMAESVPNLNARLLEREGEYRDLCNQFNQAKEQKADLEEKVQMLSKPNAKCPLCQSELGEEKHRALLEDYRRQIEAIERRIADLRARAAEVKQERESLDSEIKKLNARINAGQNTRNELTATETRITEIEGRIADREVLEASIGNLENTLKHNLYAEEHRARLREIEKEIQALAYDQDAHDRLEEEIRGLRQYQELEIQLRAAEENMPGYEANLRLINDSIERREHQMEEYLAQINGEEHLRSELEELVSEINRLSFDLTGLRNETEKIVGLIATTEHSIERCGVIRHELESLKEDLRKAEHDKAIYTDLTTAFGKKGVQALIIENAVPQIQDEANQLLARMTDNSMQVSIQTLKNNMDGKTSETLDINISDDMGTRPYELYSGGEAFRVNFALRIALSRLLSSRAGAKLQTLIIDEGFGTQDGKGREKLIEAIDSIKDDFELILVISHIDELKDAFPTRIEVVKDESGSQITII